MTLTVWSSSRYTFPLPEGHRFPVAKYAMLRDAVVAQGIVRADRVLDPPRVSDEALLLVHTAAYVRRFGDGSLDAAELRRLGFPWSPGLVERSYRAVGGTVAAARHALEHGLAMNLAGGTHHAFPDHGEGFCVFNDAAVAIRVLQREGAIRRAIVVDCDVHQGNGTAAIFARDPSAFTFSIHGARNFPFRKERGSLDVELPDGAGDDAFLAALELHVPHLLADFRPDLAVYLAGADPWREDRFGRLGMSKEGLAERDRLVLGLCREMGVPTAVAMAGGYARDTEDTVDIHVATLRIAAEMWRETVGRSASADVTTSAARLRETA